MSFLEFINEFNQTMLLRMPGILYHLMCLLFLHMFSIVGRLNWLARFNN